MTPVQPLPNADDNEPLDPELAAIAAAILDGQPVEWSAVSGGAAATISDELQIVADIAAVHRSTSDEPVDPLHFPPSYPWTVGTLIITAPLGRGTFAEVFRAWDTQLHRDVALKLLFPRPADHDGSRALQEGRLLARVRHSNVVAVHAAGRIEGRVGLVTEYVNGRTLAQIVRESGPLTADMATRIGIDLCRALAAVHATGLLHRDLKAQNVMRDEQGRIVLMDFGAGEQADAALGVAGTPLYLAPEVLAGSPATVQSDIYSLGVLLHYLVTGKHPVSGGSVAELHTAHRAGARTRLRAAAAGLPRAVADAIDRATDPQPSKRYPTAQAFETALRSAAARRRRTLVRSAIAAALLTAISAAIYATDAWRVVWPQTLPAADTASAVASRLTLPPFLHFGGPSFDGRYMTYTARGSVWTVQNATGHSREVVHAEKGVGRAETSILSSDGARAAFGWRLADRSCDLRVARIDDTWPQATITVPPPITIFRTSADGTVDPLAYAADGANVLAMHFRSDGPIELLLVKTDGPGHRVLQTFIGVHPRRASLSRDAKFVVYDFPGSPPSAQRDIFILDTEKAGSPARLVEGPSNDEVPIWSADGASVIFASDRGGRFDGWSVRVRSGAASGAPRRVARNMEPVIPVAVTSAGDLYYALQTVHDEIRSVPLDDHGVAIGAPAVLPGASAASRRAPAWSPDGRTLAHYVGRGMNLFDDGSFIRFVDVETGRTRDLRIPMIYYGFAPIRWSPDGRELVIRGKGADAKWAYHRVDVQTGAVKALAHGDERGTELNLGNESVWRRSGQSVLFTRTKEGIFEQDLATGVERLIVPAEPPEFINGLGESPDGKRIAFSTASRATGVLVTKVRVREEDGSIRDVVTRTGEPWVWFKHWMPDGGIVYALTGPWRTFHLWLLPPAGGAPREMGMTAESPRARIAVRPDGRALAFDEGSFSFEMWVMKGVAR